MVMTNFLAVYTETRQTTAVEAKKTPYLRISHREYMESRVVSALTVTLLAMDGLVQRHYFFIHNRFGPETIFKKWLFLISGLIILGLFFI